MNRRDACRQFAAFGMGAGLGLASSDAAAWALPSWLVRSVYGERVLGVVPYGWKAQRLLSLSLPVPAQRRALYRSLLPSQLDMPDEPLIYVYATELIDPYALPGPTNFESAVCIRALFKGDKRSDPRRGGWYPLAMPVTSELALQGGLQLGYPKYKAEIDSTMSPQGAQAVVRHMGVEAWRLRWQPAHIAAPSLDEAHTPFYIVQDGDVNIMETKILALTNLNKAVGMAALSIRTEAPWSVLLKGLSLSGAGTLTLSSGRFELTRRSA